MKARLSGLLSTLALTVQMRSLPPQAAVGLDVPPNEERTRRETARPQSSVIAMPSPSAGLRTDKPSLNA